MAVVAVYKNRMNLSATLKDTKTVVSKLERAIGTVLHLVFVLFYLTIWNVSLRLNTRLSVVNFLTCAAAPYSGCLMSHANLMSHAML